MDSQTIEEYFNIIISEGLHSSIGSLRFYLRYLFSGLDFWGKSVLDIGSGNGIFSFYAAVKGATQVVCLEPEGEGNSKSAIAIFNRLLNRLSIKNISLERTRIQNYDADKKTFDIIILHNSINHLDVEACINLLNNKWARDRYKIELTYIVYLDWNVIVNLESGKLTQLEKIIWSKKKKSYLNSVFINPCKRNLQN